MRWSASRLAVVRNAEGRRSPAGASAIKKALTAVRVGESTIWLLYLRTGQPGVSGGRWRSAPEELLVEQEDVEEADDGHDGPGDDDGGVAVDVDAHDVAAAGQHDEWYECEGDAEGEHDLAEHEDVGGVEADRED